MTCIFYPECNCNPAGAKEVPGYPLGGCGSSNVQPGQLCDCKEWVSGHNCDSCKPGYWNLDINNPNGCRGMIISSTSPPPTTHLTPTIHT